jgi:hypothetical protein
MIFARHLAPFAPLLAYCATEDTGHTRLQNTDMLTIFNKLIYFFTKIK